MELLDIIAPGRTGATTRYALLSELAFILAIFLVLGVFDCEFTCHYGIRVTFCFAVCFIVMAALAFIWVVIADALRDDLAVPEVLRECEGLGDLNGRFERHKYLFRNEGESTPCRVVKLFFVLLWSCGLFVALCTILRHPLSLPMVSLLVLTTLTFIINAFSYYLTCLSVWYVNELSKEERSGRLPHLRSCPEQSPIYLQLRKTSQNCIIRFLFFSISYTISFIFWAYAESHIPITSSFPQVLSGYSLVVIACSVIVLLCVASSIAFLFGPRMALRSMLDRWENEYIEETIERYGVYPGLRKDIASIRSRQYLNSADMLSILLGIASLAIDVIAVFVSIVMR